MKSADLSILVYSCWKNRDMWDVFLPLFRKYWPDCAYSLVLVTDRLECDAGRYAFDRIVAHDGTWRDMVSLALRECGTPFVMLLMDDYLFRGTQENGPMESFIAALRAYGCANIRLTKSAFTALEDFAPDPRFRRVVPGSAYSLSTQAGIWNASLLLRYMREGWSAWDFERIGSLETRDRAHPILEAADFRLPYTEGVRRGKWLPGGIRVCRANGIALDFKRRPKMGVLGRLAVRAKALVLRASPDLVQRAQNRLGGR